MTKTVILLLCYLATLSVAQGFEMGPQQTRRSGSRHPLPTPALNARDAWNDTVSPNGMSSACEFKNSRYPILGQCDAYVECKNWQPINKLCPDGLHFNPEAPLGEYPCGYPMNVPCNSTHSGLQPAQPTNECPRRNGYFSAGDPLNCGLYRVCVDGIASISHCDVGLAWNQNTYKCDRPDQVPGCDVKGFGQGLQRDPQSTLPTSSPSAALPPPPTSSYLGPSPSAIQLETIVSQNGISSACELKNSRYRMPGQCDAYVECTNWQPINRWCPDGLNFNPEASLGEYPCGYPMDVPCNSAHSGLQPAQPTNECPRRNGYFSISDVQFEASYLLCVNGQASIYTCDTGLVWNQYTYKCDRPDKVPNMNDGGASTPSPPLLPPSTPSPPVTAPSTPALAPVGASTPSPPLLPPSTPSPPVTTPTTPPAPYRAPDPTDPSKNQTRSTIAPNEICDRKNWRYSMPGQCDAYVECTDGKRIDMLCPDGLHFDPKVPVGEDPCKYPFEMPCISPYSELQPALATAECPHSYGYFSAGDPLHCGSYRQCVNGIAWNKQCPEGLAWNPNKNTCDWPEYVPGCDVEAFLGFTCPSKDYRLRHVIQEKSFRNPTNCFKFFDCLNGKPRLLSCEPGKAFDESRGRCVDSHLVQC